MVLTVSSITGAVLLLAVAVMEILLIFGLPLFGAAMILQGGGLMNMWFAGKVIKIICFVFAGFFAVNTVMNIISPSKKEKYVMTPLAAVEVCCFAVTAFLM